jgi:hypothetical protein
MPKMGSSLDQGLQSRRAEALSLLAGVCFFDETREVSVDEVLAAAEARRIPR